MDAIKVTLHDGRRLPLFWPGALVALVPGDAPGCESGQAAARRSQKERPRRGRAGRAQDSVAIGRIDCGSQRIQVRLIHRGRGDGARRRVRCRLTGFVHAPVIVSRMARTVSRPELIAARQALLTGAPQCHLIRELRVHLLVSLQAGRSLPAATRRHPRLEHEWHELVRHEHRRMLKRLRHAVRRLQRVLENDRTDIP